MRTYETIFIINPNIGDSEVEKIATNVKNYIESNGYIVIKVDLWGKRSLAYRVKKNTEGYFVLMVFQSEPNFVKQLQSYYEISEENIIKYMTTKFEGDLNKILGNQEKLDTVSPKRSSEEE